MKIKILLLLTLVSASVLSLNCQTKAADEKIKPCKFLSFAAAEKILGAPVELVTNSWNFANDKTKFDCNYRIVETDKASGRETNLFFTLEESASEERAREIYADIWQSNKNHAGIETLSEIGDEAYAHGDGRNFYFVMARKGKFTIRLKINKTAETTSFEQLKAFAKKFAEQI